MRSCEKRHRFIAVGLHAIVGILGNLILFYQTVCYMLGVRKMLLAVRPVELSPHKTICYPTYLSLGVGPSYPIDIYTISLQK